MTAKHILAAIHNEPHDTRHALAKLETLLRRDWAVRVLDAWRRQELGRAWENGPGCAMVTLFGQLPMRRFFGKTPEASRHAAALAVFPTLDVETRAKLGECP